VAAIETAKSAKERQMTKTSTQYDRRRYAADAAITVCVIVGALFALPAFLTEFDSRSGVLEGFGQLIFLIIYVIIFALASLTYVGAIAARRARAAAWSPWLTAYPTILVLGAGYLFLFKNLEYFNPHTLVRDFTIMVAAITPGAVCLALLVFI
jgi:uncharacterized membrane protein YhaH (DUF805 family)